MQSNKSVQRTFFLLFPTHNHNTVTDFVADKLSSKFQGEKSSVMTSFSLVTSFFFLLNSLPAATVFQSVSECSKPMLEQWNLLLLAPIQQTDMHVH